MPEEGNQRMQREIVLHVNGEDYHVAVEPDELLVDVLREKLGLTGTKKGCGTGDCGACTILMDGSPVTSCLILAVAAQGKALLTVEGLAADGVLHPLQQSFVDHGAVQCGYCTPGLLMMAKAILDTFFKNNKEDKPVFAARLPARRSGPIPRPASGDPQP